MDDSTRILGGTEQYPLDPGSALAAEQCPHCGTPIPAGEQFCPKCGYQRGTWQVAPAALQPAAAPAPDLAGAPFLLTTAAGARYALPEGTAILGRGEVDVQIIDGYISRKHLQVTITAGKVIVSDLGSANGSFLGETRLTPHEPVALELGAVIRLGQTEFTLVANEPALAAEPAPVAEPAQAEDAAVVAEAVVEEASAAPADLAAVGELAPALSAWTLEWEGEAAIALPHGETRLGRKADRCDIVLTGDSYISGLHCKLLATETTLELTDLGSTNGTFLNSEQLTPDQTRQLGPGDAVRLGQTEFKVAYHELADATSEMQVEDVSSGAEPEN